MDYTIPADTTSTPVAWSGDRAYLDSVAATSGGELLVVEKGDRFALAVFDPLDGFLGYL